MVCEHLDVVFTALLDIDNDDLLEPKSELDQVVPFGKAGHFARGPRMPERAEGKPIARVVHDILDLSLARRDEQGFIDSGLTIPHDQNAP